MKKVIVGFLVFLTIAVFTGCFMPVSLGGPQDPAGTPSVRELPPDGINDAPRSRKAEFTFETLLPVRLIVKVSLYDYSDAGVSETPLPPDFAVVTAALTDSRGRPVYSGRLSPDGVLDTTVFLPSALQDMTLTLEAPGFASRSVVIGNMAGLATVSRTMAMGRVAQLPLSRGMSGSGAEPFYGLNVPAEGRITIAFEDLFGKARAGDADYNDFIASYSIRETINDAGRVTRIDVDAEAMRKWAGYNHRFGIRIDSIAGSASLSGTYIDSSGLSRSFSRSVSMPAEIILFENTGKALGKTADFTLEFQTPQATEEGAEEVLLSRPPYNPYLYVIDTGHDIHLIDREPLTVSKNPGDRFIDGDGFPWALLVPTDWESPAETQRIEEAYPRFDLWRTSGGMDHGDWYNYPGQPYEPGGGVVVVGTLFDGARNVAVQWTVGDGDIQRTILHSADSSEASGVAVSGAEILVSGYINDGSGDVAVYWRNGTRVDLSAGGRATGITALGSTAYISGYYTDGGIKKAVYWVDDGSGPVRHVLPGTGASEAAGIVVATSGSVYVSGFYKNGSLNQGVYWTDSGGTLQRYDLYSTGFSEGYGILVDGVDVYIAGRHLDGILRPVLWEGGVSGFQVLGTASGIARNAAVDVGFRYAVGDYLGAGSARRAAYWKLKDGTMAQTDLFGPEEGETYGYGIGVSDGVVHVAGVYQNGLEQAVYWKNGVPRLLEPGVNSRAEALTMLP